MEQSAVDECFRGGGWAKRMGMCSEEQRGFERCFLMQSVRSWVKGRKGESQKAGMLTIKDRL